MSERVPSHGHYLAAVAAVEKMKDTADALVSNEQRLAIAQINATLAVAAAVDRLASIVLDSYVIPVKQQP